jgi:glutathione peroxidase-family protein
MSSLVGSRVADDATVTFPMLGKTEVNGTNVDPLWEWMKNEQPGILGLTRIKVRTMEDS